MLIRIVPIKDNESYTVNGKEIYKDSEGNYIARTEMSTMELNAFRNYKKAVIENKAFKTHTKATYKG